MKRLNSPIELSEGQITASEVEEIQLLSADDNKLTQRIYLVTDGLGSKYTERLRYAFAQFQRDGAKTTDLQVLLDYKPRVLEQMTIGYIEHLRDKGRAPKTISLHVAAILHFFEMNDIVLNKRKITRFIPPDVSAYYPINDKVYIQTQLIYTSLIAVLLVAVSSAQLSSVVLSNGTVVYAYSNSQAQSLDNTCGNDGSSGINCANSGPQNIGDDTVTSLTPLQLSNSGKEGPPGPPGPDKVLEKRQTDSNPPPPSLPIVQPGATSTRSAECNSDSGGYRISEAGSFVPGEQPSRILFLRGL